MSLKNQPVRVVHFADAANVDVMAEITDAGKTWWVICVDRENKRLTVVNKRPRPPHYVVTTPDGSSRFLCTKEERIEMINAGARTLGTEPS